MSDTVIYFSATWCGPCKAVGKAVEDLQADFPDVEFHKVDVDEQPEQASKHSVRAMPTLVRFQDGTEVARVVGAKPKSVLVQELGL